MTPEMIRAKIQAYELDIQCLRVSNSIEYIKVIQDEIDRLKGLLKENKNA